jgi:hypothetical protein
LFEPFLEKNELESTSGVPLLGAFQTLEGTGHKCLKAWKLWLQRYKVRRTLVSERLLIASMPAY